MVGTLAVSLMVAPSASKITNSKSEVIRTPWGDLAPTVDVLPVVYILLAYGVLHFLPFQILGWLANEDGLAEWLQFCGYLFAGFSALVVLVKGRFSSSSVQVFWWILLTIFCFFIAGEEISWGERITGIGFDTLRDLSTQGESNFHNLEEIQTYLHFSFIASGLFFGWIGWRFWPSIQAFPAKRFSLYFLFVALFYTYFDLSYIVYGDRIRNYQEVFELLMALGLFLHCFSYARPLLHSRRSSSSSRD